MPTFMCFLNWTDQAAKALKDAPKRYEATKALVTKPGGRLVCAYVTTGQYDVALVVEMPNGDPVSSCDNLVRECADDNRAGVRARGVWKTRRRSTHDDLTIADFGTAWCVGRPRSVQDVSDRSLPTRGFLSRTPQLTSTCAVFLIDATAPFGTNYWFV